MLKFRRFTLPASMRGVLLLSSCVIVSLSVWSQPIITSISPVSGPVGSSVIISGSNFSTTPSNNIVYFGAVRANVTAASVSSLTVTVPPGANYQPVTVTVAGLTAYSANYFIVTYPNGLTITNAAFEPKVEFTTDLMPHDLVVADFDGDGKPDMATSNNYISGVLSSFSVLRNTSTSGGISFAPRQDFVNGAGSFAIASGDIDGDGKPDIVVNSNFDSKISVFRNTSVSGTISFAPKVEFATGANAYAIVIRDVDNDGKPDISFINNVSGGLSIYRNTSAIGTITLAPRVDFSTSLTPYDLVSADFDGDAKTDFAVSNNSGTSVSIYRNTSIPGTISLAVPVDIQNGAGNQPFGLQVADLDNDGKSDLCVMIQNTSGSAAQLFRNASTPGVINLPFGFSLSAGNNIAYHIGAGDVNGDGKADLVLGATHLDKSVVYQNNSTTGSFQFGAASEFITFDPYTVLFADLDADSKPELLAARFTGDAVAVLKNRCDLPGIISFNPTSGNTGTIVTINGVGFTGATAVSFGGIPASSFTVVNSTTITATVGVGASGEVVVVTPLGTVSLGGFTFTGPPTITSFNPTSAGTGITVTITGTNFTNANAVSFGGVAASSFTVVSSTTITAVVASGASGSVSVTTPFGTGSLPGFTYVPAPVITSFTPGSAATGATVTITGNNFTGANAISFGGVAASSFTVVNATTITAVVGNGSSGNVSVSTNGGTGTMPGFIYIPPPPVVSSFTPVTAITGTTVTITGVNFLEVTGVSFGGVAAISFTTVNSTTITAVVGYGATGNVTVTTLGGSASLAGFSYIPPPQITSFTPVSGPIGTSVTITGNNFSPVASNNIVYFGTVRAIVNSASATSLTVTVPAGANYRPISVTVNTLTSISVNSFLVTFPGGGIISSGSFEPKIDIPSASRNSGIVISDMDNDGKPDIAVTTTIGPHAVGVYRNVGTAGSIAFGSRINLPTNGGEDIITSDVDGDGLKDLLTVGGGMEYHRNTSTTGNITFAPFVSVVPVGALFRIAAGDLDADGRVDIVAVNTSAENIQVFKNNTANGIVSFASPVLYPVGDDPWAVAIGDLDGDLKPEVIVSNYYDGNISVFRNTSVMGAISFAPLTNFQIVNPSRGLCLADMNGDQKLDIVGNSIDSIAVRLNTTAAPGSISFGSQFRFSVPGSFRVSVDDIDGDGKPDLAVSIQASTNVAVLRNTTTGTTPSFAAPVPFTVGSFPIGIATGDLDSDQKPEIVVANYNSPNFSILQNSVSGSAITSFSPTSGGTGTVITITGTNFTGATAVSFGGTAASSFTILNPTTITAVVANGSTGSVRVTTPVGIASLPGFTFIAAPTISLFNPTSGGPGTVITITGTNFTGATIVRFGGVAAASFVVNSPTTITATVAAAGASGDVTVTTAGGTASRSGFTFIALPVITSFTPTSGGAGSSITITGSNLTGATAVSFGGVAAASFVVNSSTSISAIVGTGASGNVAVTTGGGTGNSPGFVFIPAPVITSFTPGSAATGESVVITGSNFTGATSVTFGGVAATSFIVNSSTIITAIVGTGASGAIAVTTPYGTGVSTGTGFIYNIVTGIGNPSNSNSKELIVSPNPSTDQVLVKHPSSIKVAELRFIDMLGREIRKLTVPRNTKETSTSVKGFVGGIYQVLWSDGTRILSRTILVDN